MKDGGYIAANWQLYDAQQRLARLAGEFKVKITFFHGRGGALGRGGGPAAQAVLSLPAASVAGRLRVTEQGEVVAERYGDPLVAHRHLEQLTWATMLVSAQMEPPPDPQWIRLGVARVLEKFVASFPDIGGETSFLVAAAATGEEAVACLHERPPDIMLLDLKLPGIGGLDVLKEARGLETPVLTIMITAYASLATAVEVTREGTFDFLPKPFTPSEIRGCGQTRHA